MGIEVGNLIEAGGIPSLHEIGGSIFRRSPTISRAGAGGCGALGSFVGGLAVLGEGAGDGLGSADLGTGTARLAAERETAGLHDAPGEDGSGGEDGGDGASRREV